MKGNDIIIRVTTHARRINRRTNSFTEHSECNTDWRVRDGRALEKNDETANVTELDDSLYTRGVGAANNRRIEGR